MKNKIIISIGFIFISIITNSFAATMNHSKSGENIMSKTSTDYMPSLITKTPLEGRMLAITILRKTIGAIQPDGTIKHKVRLQYHDNAELLLKIAGLVAIEFKTIAIANNYWR